MTCIRHSLLDCAVCGCPEQSVPTASQKSLLGGPTMASTNTNTTGRAKRGTASYAAGEHLHKHGPMNQHELFAKVDMGHKTGHQQDTLQRAIRSGWLIERIDGKITISAYARAHYDQIEGEKVRPVGQIAAMREANDVFKRPALSKKYMPNSRGIRQDIPAWSVRNGQAFHTKA